MSAETEKAANRLESLVLTLLFTVISSCLFAILTDATRSNARGGWWTQPWLMPALALGVLALSNVLTLARTLADLRANPLSLEERTEGLAALWSWLKPLEFLIYFGGYVWIIQHTGYAVGTALYVALLLWRSGLTQLRWILSGIGLVVFMILVFRVGLGVWMPAPDFYDLFPKAIRSALMRWF